MFFLLFKVCWINFSLVIFCSIYRSFCLNIWITNASSIIDYKVFSHLDFLYFIYDGSAIQTITYFYQLLSIMKFWVWGIYILNKINFSCKY